MTTKDQELKLQTPEERGYYKTSMELPDLQEGEFEPAIIHGLKIPIIIYREMSRLIREEGMRRDRAFRQAAKTIREQYPGKTTQELIELSRELYRQGKL